MSEAFWHAKIRGIVNNVNLNYLKQKENSETTKPYWQKLEQVLTENQNQGDDIIELADQITNASDRHILNQMPLTVNGNRCIVSHLLSGKSLKLSSDFNSVRGNGKNIYQQNQTNENQTTTDISVKELFWWLWRCLPEIACQNGQESILLTPANDILPDVSLWSDNSITAAMAGALTGFDQESKQKSTQLPHLVTFSFTPIQELIKASRKMRDFWAGSWVLHYLSAKICWKLAYKYGPDSLIYPSLFQQPLIDNWLIEDKQWPNMKTWIKAHHERALLTAGFPNVIVAILPEDEVECAMQNARQTLLEEWAKLGKKVFEELEKRKWTRNLEQNSSTWNKWLKNQWQTYWTGLPIASKDNDSPKLSSHFNDTNWLKKLNRIANLPEGKGLFRPQESQFMESVEEFVQKKDSSTVEVNVGSWWPYIFDQLRFAAGSVKNSRTWKIPTAFLSRSTISGIGSVVYDYDQADANKTKHITEADTAKYWEKNAGLFDGSEKLNATEVLKRTLHLILPEILPNPESSKIERLLSCYPDLTSGVAGWLRSNPTKHVEYFKAACDHIKKEFPWTNQSFPDKNRGDKPPALLPWGIPWVDENNDQESEFNSYNPRLLNVGWLMDDFELQNDSDLNKKTEEFKSQKKDAKKDLEKAIAKYFTTGNNPTDWYVIAAGDGDGMSKWLKGDNLKEYGHYMPTTIDFSSFENDSTAQNIEEKFNQLKTLIKRMGPSSHNAFSRALLDFSNQLVPYLTEQRYAGRLIYGGGDDVLAYTNLWEWDRWLWDIHECFRGATDPQKPKKCKDSSDSDNSDDSGSHLYNDGYFNNEGDYWRWQKDKESLKNASGNNWEARLPSRPLFTMGHNKSSLSFGVVIAHHSVPLAIALENLWAAEVGAKQYKCGENEKDAIQVKVLFGSGNVLEATSKFEVFHQWSELLNNQETNIESSLFEQAAQLWQQHPAPISDAIKPWTNTFCDRRDIFKGNDTQQQNFPKKLEGYLTQLFASTNEDDQNKEVQNWLKLAAFVLRNRKITTNS